MLIYILNLGTMSLAVLLSIAFFTLMERKVISFSQNRKGPNKTAVIGIIQPIADAIKLLTKEINMNKSSNFMIYMLSPALNILLSMMMWMTFPFILEFSFMKMSTLFVMSCMAANTLSIIMMSWSSNSNYAFIGMMRTISQLISYEINLIMIVLVIINLTNQTSFLTMWKTQGVPIALTLSPVLVIWIFVILAETNRTPFDFSEGESELISGFNIEYGSSSFIFLFLSEYSSILLMSMLTTLMFTSFKVNESKFYLMYISICFLFIWTRTTLPRFRYDKLMKLNWTQLLPTTTFILMWSFMYKMYCTMKS